jgi:CBS domain-containing protein
MKASDLMTKDVFTCTVDESSAFAAHIMCNQDVGVVPVVDPQGAVLGVVTDRDLMKAAYHSERPLDQIPVKDAMSRNVISIRPDDDVYRIAELMQVNQVRRVPVIDDDGLLRGIVAMADLARRNEGDVAETLGAISQPHAAPLEEQGELHVHV